MNYIHIEYSSRSQINMYCILRNHLLNEDLMVLTAAWNFFNSQRWSAENNVFSSKLTEALLRNMQYVLFQRGRAN